MPELFDTGSVHDDAAHWDRRAALVAERAMAAKARPDRRGDMDAWSRSRATWAAACLLFAAGLLLMVLSRAPSPESEATSWRVLLAPPDDVGQLLATRGGPPPIGALLQPGPETRPR